MTALMSWAASLKAVAILPVAVGCLILSSCGLDGLDGLRTSPSAGGGSAGDTTASSGGANAGFGGDPAIAIGGDAGSNDGGRVSSGGDSGGAVSQPGKYECQDALCKTRLSCAFKAGDAPSVTLGVPSTTAFPIKHVVVVVKDGRSFDHLFGALNATQPDADVFDSSFTNLNSLNEVTRPFRAATSCWSLPLAHGWNAMAQQVNNGAMDGFIKVGTDAAHAFSYYTSDELPFYYFLANTYAIADRYFSSVRSDALPNRHYLLMAASGGALEASTDGVGLRRSGMKSIFELLDEAKLSFRVYADAQPLAGVLDAAGAPWGNTHAWYSTQSLMQDFKNGTLPNVAFVDARIRVEDESGSTDLQLGEAFTKRIYDAAVASPAWSSSALLLTHADSGGFFDHVPPPETACIATAEDTQFDKLGVRVPLIAISPWARRHYVSHSLKEHTAVTRFIETIFNLPALTARDANSDALLDMFDFNSTPVPAPPAPPAGKGSCAGDVRISLSKSTYAPGEQIVVNFEGAPGGASDWIGLYHFDEYPRRTSLLWKYVGTNTQNVGGSVKSGYVTLDAASVHTTRGYWPLISGRKYAAFFLLNDGYQTVAYTTFEVLPAP
jgi:phospholipase C